MASIEGKGKKGASAEQAGQDGPKKRRILALDGGGVKGINEALILNEIEQRTGRKIADMFDLVVGTSTGALNTVGMVVLGMKAEEIGTMMQNLCNKVFRPAPNPRIRYLQGLGWYDSVALKKTIADLVEDRTMRDTTITTKFALVAADISLSDTVEFVFRNYDLPQNTLSGDPEFRYAENWGISDNLPILDCLLSSASAPTYFDPVKMKIRGVEKVLVDGGLKANNPVQLAWQEAKMLWPNDDISLIVSVGTGIQKRDYWGHGGLFHTSKRVIDIATDSEGTHADFSKLLRSINYPGKYVRLNPSNPDGVSLDCTDTILLNRMKDNTMRYINQERTRVQINSIVNEIERTG